VNPYTTRSSVKGAQAQLAYSSHLFDVTGGIDWTKYDIETISIDYGGSHIVRKNTSGFLLGKLKLLDDSFIVNAGLRYDKYTATTDITQGANTDSQGNWNPSVGISYLPLDWLKVRFNYGKGFHLPTPTQLSQNFESGGILFKGNPDLKPTNTDSFEFGADLSQAFWNFTATYFYTIYKDKIATDTESQPGVSTFKNIPGKTFYGGIELSGAFDITGYLNYDFTLEPFFTLTKFTTRKEEDPATGTSYVPRNLPEWVMSYGLTFDHPGVGFYANVTASYLGSYNTTSSFNSSWENGYATEAVVAPAKTLVDLTVRKTLWENSDYNSKVSLQASVRNVFDLSWRSNYDYPGPGRQFYVGLMYDFE
jgi:vitamin B12 transporter